MRDLTVGLKSMRESDGLFPSLSKADLLRKAAEMLDDPTFMPDLNKATTTTLGNTLRDPDDDLLRAEMRAAHNANERDTAYNERNHLVALLARIFPSGWVGDVTTPDWFIIYVDLPTGQASWHIPEAERGLFAGIPPYDKTWDNHTTAEKYKRIDKLAGILTDYNVSITPQTQEI